MIFGCHHYLVIEKAWDGYAVEIAYADMRFIIYIAMKGSDCYVTNATELVSEVSVSLVSASPTAAKKKDEMEAS